MSRKSKPPGDLGWVPIPPELGNDDSLMLMFLTSVQIWSMSFYESVQTKNGASASVWQPGPEQSQQVNRTFKLVIDMLNRGHGSLAGRLARKAFLLVEEMLMLDGPALVWNMLEIMYHMVIWSHLQLFRLLLAHLMALVDCRMPKTHPLLSMLRALRALVRSLPTSTPTPSSTFLTSPAWPRSSDRNEPRTATDSWLFSGIFLSMIERAWTLNAEILFNRFDDRLFQLYSGIYWDSCSIKPPTAIIGAAKQWLGHITLPQISSITAKAVQTEGFVQNMPFAKDRMLQRLSETPENAWPPRNYEDLRVSCVRALRDHANSILGRDVIYAGDTTVLLHILAGLVTAKFLEERPASTDLPNIGRDARSRISRGQLACAVKTSIDLDAEYDGLEALSDTVGRMRALVALREYAHAETDPRVIRDLWLLEDALVAAGEHRKAFDVKQTAYRRLEEYIQDISVNFA